MVGFCGPVGFCSVCLMSGGLISGGLISGGLLSGSGLMSGGTSFSGLSNGLISSGILSSRLLSVDLRTWHSTIVIQKRQVSTLHFYGLYGPSVHIMVTHAHGDCYHLNTLKLVSSSSRARKACVLALNSSVFFRSGCSLAPSIVDIW